jgi:hypothetical protein
MRVFEEMVLMGIFGPKKNEVTGRWRKLHDKRFHYLYSSLNVRLIKNKSVRWAENALCTSDNRNEYKVLAGNSGWKRQLERSSGRWKDNIIMSVKK